MKCPRCNTELSDEDVEARTCSRCQEKFDVGYPVRGKMLLVGLGVAGLAVYSYLDREPGDSIVGVVILGMLAALLILRSRR